MGTSFRGPGSTLEFTAGGNFTKDLGYVEQNTFGVSANTGVSGDTQILQLGGKFDLPTDGVVSLAAGDDVFWDDTAKQVQASASGHFKIGVAAGASASSRVEVILTEVSVVAVA